MIIFKTELEKMPSCCIYCSAEYKCKYAFPINLDMQEALKLPPIRPTACPLVEIPDPKPELTLTQHEHDLIEIIKKVYPDVESIVIYKKYDEIYFVSNPMLATWHRIEDDKFGYHAVGLVDLFDKHKLPTLLSELTETILSKQFYINDLLSRPIRKENPNAETKI